jgi:nicotinate-nucleotide pyrophosphorylase (carboxylating)
LPPPGQYDDRLSLADEGTSGKGGRIFVVEDFRQWQWNDGLAEDVRRLVNVAKREDLDEGEDLTTNSLVPAGRPGRAAIVVRETTTLAGLRAAQMALAAYGGNVAFVQQASDGDTVGPKTAIAEIAGSARTLLTAERVMLNLLGRLCGVATLTRQFVDAVAGTGAHIYDTRKTTPGFRRLEKYAVRCGGGRNHRTGLYDAVLIKDNHLAFGGHEQGKARFSGAEAVVKARDFVRERSDTRSMPAPIVEVEVDTLEQLALVLSVAPDIVLLDNMHPEMLAEAVAIRNSVNPAVQLEASGGVNLVTIRAIAETGVERISVGALTHASRWIDVGLDWAE